MSHVLCPSGSSNSSFNASVSFFTFLPPAGCLLKRFDICSSEGVSSSVDVGDSSDTISCSSVSIFLVFFASRGCLLERVSFDLTGGESLVSGSSEGGSSSVDVGGSSDTISCSSVSIFLVFLAAARGCLLERVSFDLTGGESLVSGSSEGGSSIVDMGGSSSVDVGGSSDKISCSSVSIFLVFFVARGCLLERVSFDLTGGESLVSGSSEGGSSSVDVGGSSSVDVGGSSDKISCSSVSIFLVFFAPRGCLLERVSFDLTGGESLVSGSSEGGSSSVDVGGSSDKISCSSVSIFLVFFVARGCLLERVSFDLTGGESLVSGSSEGGSSSLDVGGSSSLDVGGSSSLDVGGSSSLDMGGSSSLDVGGSSIVDEGGSGVECSSEERVLLDCPLFSLPLLAVAPISSLEATDAVSMGGGSSDAAVGGSSKS